MGNRTRNTAFGGVSGRRGVVKKVSPPASRSERSGARKTAVRTRNTAFGGVKKSRAVSRHPDLIIADEVHNRVLRSILVAVSCGGLRLDFIFPTAQTARDFIEAGSRSSSIDGLSLSPASRSERSGKGGRDGGAS